MKVFREFFSKATFLSFYSISNIYATCIRARKTKHAQSSLFALHHATCTLKNSRES